MPYTYPKGEDLFYLAAVANNWADLAIEHQDPDVLDEVKKLAEQIKAATERIKNLPGNKELCAAEPNDLEGIFALAPKHRSYPENKLPEDYKERLMGAVIGRAAGCILGAIVEGYEIDYMKAWAAHHGDAFPPEDYFSAAPGMPGTVRYTKSKNEEYLKQNLKICPVDDDIGYMQLALLILEEYGCDFTTNDVGKAWAKYLPMAYTAEEVALNNVKAGVEGIHAAEGENPFVNLIGGAIRADTWGYVCPGNPERAAVLAYRDGYLTHRRTGLYGEMYFAAVIAAAFRCKTPFEALYEGLNYIPENSLMAKSVRWALEYRKNITDYQSARDAVDKKFYGMPIAHTLNNACLTIFALQIGGNDYSKVISECVAMGLDNDCTTATAGSIFGAVYGIDAIDPKWYRPFNGKMDSYFNGVEPFEFTDFVDRVTKQAEKMLENLG